MKKIITPRNIDISFHISLIIKGLFDLGEFLCGIITIFLTPERMRKLITFITSSELKEDPNDFIMRRLISFSETFSINSQLTASVYLLSHSFIKLLIIIFLWKQKLWVYPVSCVVFAAFVVIQLLDFTQTHSITLLFVTFVDIFMIILTILEYRNISIKYRKSVRKS
ncbi:DUF2127 domain-containing protein [Anaerocolumna chitinilytica]|uniref:DUF2127 domain-containing protein n=1 Tax=Anaerocolumna chitinilytica TaxID=1727145 RepID=UPI00162A2C54